MGTGDPIEVAEGTADGEQKLPGEEESEGSPLLEDALHWQRVYEELLTLERTLLRTEEADGTGAGRHPLESELRRLERRRGFWEQRVRELRSG
ncbi:MAG TPA: hypothetical protein VKF59_19555 [Candidatus Dormibacteraeota bacterium]|nr:hypothetical protein [Candidatus Dormibacteraeota bacterium]